MRGERTIPAPPGFYGCPCCETVKPVAEFSASKKGPDGHACFCRACKMQKKRDLQARYERGEKEDLTIAERFFAKVYKGGEGGCWIWTSTSQRYGYGSISWKGKMHYAHRVSWFLAGNELPQYPEGPNVIDHICRNTLCVNPAHLRVVSQRDNCVTLCDSPYGINARKTECKHGHPLAGMNVARILNRGKSGAWNQRRTCLTCYPSYANHRLRFFLPEDVAGVFHVDARV